MFRYASSLHVSSTVWSVCLLYEYHKCYLSEVFYIISQFSGTSHCTTTITYSPPPLLQHHFNFTAPLPPSSLYHSHHTSTLLPSITNAAPSLDHHYPSTITTTTLSLSLHLHHHHLYRTISSPVTQLLHYHFTIPTSPPHHHLSISAPPPTPLHLFCIKKPLPSLHHYTSTTNNTPSLGYYISTTTNTPSLFHYITTISL